MRNRKVRLGDRVSYDVGKRPAGTLWFGNEGPDVIGESGPWQPTNYFINDKIESSCKFN